MNKKQLQPFTPILYIVISAFIMLSCNTNISKHEDFKPIFDGKSLDNWEGNLNIWTVENGIIYGITTPKIQLKKNTFLIWKGGTPSDFELKLEFKISKNGNSGVNYRSETVKGIPYALRGYQADIDGKHKYTGQNYEERKRATLGYRGEKAAIYSQDKNYNGGSLRANITKNCWTHRKVLQTLNDSDSLKAKIKNHDWNQLHLIIKGNRLKHYVNGVLFSDVIDKDSINRALSGKIGLQVHVGPPMKVQYRNILLKEI
ncbi:3-keto-disaccharide hydrolase [Flavicella sediminum]|uniref:3-keto-disaccharide hydrolase n=1 Tax=Flavicella sediminum TaxID=2585141 RepID=UPI0011245F03|nr:DUF1080 domain-containing protein [Flavicella sediminum]